MVTIDMEIPKGCAGCPLEHKGLNFCGYSDFIEISDAKRPSNCPLKEIPGEKRIKNMIAMLEEIREKLIGEMIIYGEHGEHDIENGIGIAEELIQQKIDKLKK